jgi:hypothetical protein
MTDTLGHRDQWLHRVASLKVDDYTKDEEIDQLKTQVEDQENRELEMILKMVNM